MAGVGLRKKAARIQPWGFEGQHPRRARGAIVTETVSRGVATRHARGVILTVLATGGLASYALYAWSRRARPRVEDGTRLRTIAELGEGRFRVRGRIVPLETVPSAVDGARCVYVLRASVDPEQGLLRDVAHELRAFPFRVEDGTGAIEVDPACVLVDAPSAHGDAGLVVEQRLRAGEEVDVVARFRPCARGCAPYRGAGHLLEPVPDEADPPRVSPTAEPLAAEVVTPPGVALARGAAAVVLGASALLAWWIG